jgi:hypothetical protein
MLVRQRKLHLHQFRPVWVSVNAAIRSEVSASVVYRSRANPWNSDPARWNECGPSRRRGYSSIVPTALNRRDRQPRHDHELAGSLC